MMRKVWPCGGTTGARRRSSGCPCLRACTSSSGPAAAARRWARDGRTCTPTAAPRATCGTHGGGEAAGLRVGPGGRAPGVAAARLAGAAAGRGGACGAWSAWRRWTPWILCARGCGRLLRRRARQPPCAELADAAGKRGVERVLTLLADFWQRRRTAKIDGGLLHRWRWVLGDLTVKSTADVPAFPDKSARRGTGLRCPTQRTQLGCGFIKACYDTLARRWCRRRFEASARSRIQALPARCVSICPHNQSWRVLII
jgi:hypothetical protein